jgi:GTP-binding protein
MDLRNIAIIAHVDHGKTTLVDALLKQSGAVRDNQRVSERALDSNDLERERGITILAKCTSVVWKDPSGREIRINIVDTPGHADFGGEVERVLSMVDGVLLLVDAADGPMPQTKFVTTKALARGLRPIVVINKVDRPDARPEAAHGEVLDLFDALGASESQLDFPVIFASAKEGWARECVQAERGQPRDMSALFNLIIRHVPSPEAASPKARAAPFSMLVTILEADAYLGRLLTGRIETGKVGPNITLAALSRNGARLERALITRVLAFRGLARQNIDEAQAGDIVTLAGFKQASVADTLCDVDVQEAIAAPPIDPPTMAVTFQVNDSPYAGREGSKVQSRVIRARLWAEAEGNVAIKVTETEKADSFEVAGRGELQLGVLIETMRREGFEFAISRPRVLMRDNPRGGPPLEPIEEVVVDVDDEHSGGVIEKLSQRRAELVEMRPSGGGKTRLVFDCPSRGLIGYHGEFLTDTRGTGVMNRLFKEYGSYRGPIEDRHRGVLVSMAEGAAVAYALRNIEGRGTLFIEPGTPVYSGMIVGENARGEDLEVNPLKTKHLTNIRAAGKDDTIRLTPPRRLSLEQAIAYIGDDELVEVTPKSIRLRKRHLDANLRKRQARASAQPA